MATTERHHTTRGRNFVVFAQLSKAADKFFQDLQRKIGGDSVRIFGTRIHPRGIFSGLKRVNANAKKMSNDLETR
jgi:hypothetical protein